MSHKLLFISKVALINDIAWQAVKEGNDVKYYIEDVDQRDIADGFVPKTDDWRKEIDWAEAIVIDDVSGQGKLAEELRSKGKKVVGGTAYSDMLEDDRSFGQRELIKHGIKTIPFWEFNNFDEAVQFVKDHPDKYVIKPSGAAQNIKHLLFVGQEKDGSDVVRILESYKRVWSKWIKVFQLQKKVEGVEIAIGAFFNGHDYVHPINVNFEHKKLFPGEFGPATGEMGTSMFWAEPNNLFKSTLEKLTETLRQEGYIGYIDLNCIVNSFGIYPLEFTCRFGYPTISIQQEGMITPIGEFLYQLANGAGTDLKVKKGFQVGVSIVVPPYPFDDQETFAAYSKDAVIAFKNGGNIAGIHIQEVKLVNDQWVVAGFEGYALIVVGCGLTMKEAQKQAYSRVKNVLIPNMYYRVDIGDRWYDEFDKLHSWGYIK